MRRRLLGSLASVSIATLLFVGAAEASQWVGKATNLKGDFNYGKVTFTVKGSLMKNLIIEAVTTQGCGGYKSVVVPKVRIRGSRFQATYVPVPGLDDTIKVSGTIRGSKATGKFREFGLCNNEGKFTARKR